MIKTYKIEAKPLGKLIDIDNSQFYDILFSLRCEHRLCANKVVRYIWEQNNKDDDFKAATNAYPTKDERLEATGYSSVSGMIYNKIKKEFVLLNSTVLSACQQMADKQMRNDRKAIYNGSKSIPSYNNNLPIELPKSSIHISYDANNGDWIVGLALLSNVYRKKLGLTRGILPFRLIVKNNIAAVLMDCETGKASICGSKLRYDTRTNKYYLILCVKSEPKSIDKHMSADKTCIVHLGIYNAVSCSTTDDDKPLIIAGGEIEQFRAKHNARRYAILKQRTYCGEGSIGHGTKKRIAAAYKDSEAVSNFRNTINHTYAKHIVDYAVKNKCGIIQLENLSGITERLLFLKTWSYFDLQSKIKEKAKLYDIQITTIPYPMTDKEIKNAYNSDKQ